MINRKEDIIFKQTTTGLGDTLQWSTLPERYNERGNKFFIHKENEVHNQGIYDLVWGQNPHVQPESSSKKVNCTYHVHMDVSLSQKYNARNFVEWSEISHGFQIENSKPRIYYEPNNIEKYNYLDVIDLGSITCFKRGFYNIKNLIETINNIIDKKNTLLIKSKHSKSPVIEHFENLNCVEVNNIFEYTDLIRSCKTFYCLYSGGASLASAVRPQGAFVFFPEIDRKKEINSGSHLYPNNIYYCGDTTLNDMPIWRFR